MRTKKLRAWDERNGGRVMRDMNYIYTFLEQGGKFDDGQLLFLEFTGLLDKNGNEIYEGDIVHWQGCKWPLIVRHSDFGYRAVEKEGMIGETLASIAFSSEIIGNVYVNSGLLQTLIEKI